MVLDLASGRGANNGCMSSRLFLRVLLSRWVMKALAVEVEEFCILHFENVDRQCCL